MTKEKRLEVMSFLMDIAELAKRRVMVNDEGHDVVKIPYADSSVNIIAPDNLGRELAAMGMSVIAKIRKDSDYDENAIWIDGVKIYWLVEKPEEAENA